MKIKNRQDFLVVLTLAAAGLFIAVNFILSPLADWWSVRSKQITDLHTKVDDGQKLLKRETALRSKWAEMQAGALPANSSLAEQQLMKAFDTWRNDTGAELASIMPQWKNESTNYMTISCRVELAGSLGTLSRYLYELEQSPLALRVDTVELSSHDNTGQQLTLGLEVNGLALTQPEKK
ncbi:MAG: GspMb/PilO family protein [Verrucomicrobiae bacterium]|nr:GspMb/PilO family protein [Verrucomicrobiae bacterium]